MNLIQSGEGLNRKRLKFLKEEGVLSANRVQHTASNLTAVSTLPAYPADYGFASLHKQMSQFLEINLSHESHIYVYTHTCIYIYMYTHTHTSYWFPFSGELWYSYWCKSLEESYVLGGKVMSNLDSILKSRDITLPTKVHLVKAVVFPAVMYGCESLTIKKAEHQRTNAFELWCWRRFLRAPWTARRSNQSILNKITPKCSLEELMLKLKLQYFGHLMQRTDSLEKTWCWEVLRAGGEGDDRGGDGWVSSLTQWTWVWISSSSWWWTGKPGVLQSMGSQRVGHDWMTELNWELLTFSPGFSQA